MPKPTPECEGEPVLAIYTDWIARKLIIARAADLARAGQGELAIRLREWVDALPPFEGVKAEGGEAVDVLRHRALAITECSLDLQRALSPHQPGGQHVGTGPSVLSTLRDIERAIAHFKEGWRPE